MQGCQAAAAIGSRGAGTPRRALLKAFKIRQAARHEREIIEASSRIDRFVTSIKAQVFQGPILFYGASVEVDVHNSYKSNLFGAGHAISVAAERSVTFTESGIKCSVDNHVIDVKLEDRSMAKT